MRRSLHRGLTRRAIGMLIFVATGPAFAQTMSYGPDRGESFRYQTSNRLTVSQRILERDQHYTMRSSGVVRLTLLDSGPRLLWRMGFDELDLSIEGAFPNPSRETLRGTVVTLSTTGSGVVLEARASGIVPPGVGVRYLERAASSFFPQLPDERATLTRGWSDTLSVTEVMQGVTTEIQMVLRYAVADTGALGGGPVIPVEYEGELVVSGAGTISGSRVDVEGAGTITGYFLFNPATRMFDVHERRQELDSTLTLRGPEDEFVEIPSRQVLEGRAERIF